MGTVLLLELCEVPTSFKRLIFRSTVLPRKFVYASNYLPKFINRKIHPVPQDMQEGTAGNQRGAFDILEKKAFQTL